MLGTAVLNVLKKSCLLILGIVISSMVSLYWRDQQISVFGFCLILLAVLGALALVAVPVELHKVRNGR